MRKSLALILSAGLLLSLAACSGSPSAENCTPATPSGDSSSAVTASGELGADPAATFPTPLAPKKVERSVLIDGDTDGAPAVEGGAVLVTYTIYDGTSGQGTQTAPTLIALPGQLPPEFTDAFLCSTPGSRLSIAVPAETASAMFQTPGAAVMVADVTDTYPNKATGADQPAQSGFPSVVHAPDGRPGITIVSGDAPTDAKAALLKKGDGAVVAEGDTIVAQATAVSYAAPKDVVNTTWEDGTPQIWTMAEPPQPSQASWQPAGITPFLVGETVGSEVLVVLPDASGGSATAYVVDILGVLPVLSN